MQAIKRFEISRRAGHWAVALSGLLVLLGMALPARAALVISAPSFSAVQGSTGSFDLLITDTDSAGSLAIKLAGYSLKLSVGGATGVTFTAATINTVADPYVFVTSGTTQPPPTPLAFDTFPNTAFTPSDSEFASPGYRAFSPNNVFGLVHVTYSVNINAVTGDRPLTITSASGTDDGANAISTPVTNGLVTVTAAPEPGALALLGVSAIGLLNRRRRS